MTNPLTPMSPEVRLAPNRAREDIDRMMQPYLADLGAPGFAYPNLDAYWKDSTRYPYLIVHDNQILGFALVHRVTDDPSFELVEFYIAAQFRNRGFGREAAEALFKFHLGMWSVAVRRDNSAGRAFWSSVLSNHSSVTAVELETPQGIMYTFPSKGCHDA
jgi:predicted acetyltransferase